MNEILTPIGYGAAFAPEFGNNCWYYKRENNLLLIDCGETAFQKLKSENLLETENIYVLITHMHPDHIGSLGEIIFYCYYIFNKKITIIFPQGNKIKSYLNLVGIEDELYLLNEQNENISYNLNYKIKDTFNITISPILTSHVPQLNCFGYYIKTNDFYIYYSGDSNEINKIAYQMLFNNELDRIYQEVCGQNYEGNVHLFIDDLYNFIKFNLKLDILDKIICMHFDSINTIYKAQKMGFNTPVDRKEI